MADLLNTLASYVPALITRRLVNQPAPLTTPLEERSQAVVFFADISGFTRLTEALAQTGPAGAEQLNELLNTYFGKLIKRITQHGGDVVKFAGDALIALWQIDEQHHLQDAVFYATQCAIKSQERLAGFQATETIELALKIGISVGEVAVFHVGGVYGRWEYLVTGEAVTAVGHAEHLAQPSQIILTKEAWAQIDQAATASPVGNEGHMVLETLTVKLPPKPLDKPIPGNEAKSATSRYIPGAIMSRLNAGQMGWLAELRQITVLFVNLPSLTDNTDIDDAQNIIRTLQNTLYKYEGSVNKISIDDKGTSLLAVLGLPPLTHADDTARGLLAGLEMRREMRKLGHSCAIGITTGQAFCGAIGTMARREYTMLGDVVNMAARLMQAALLYGDALSVLCDAVTEQTAVDRVQCAPLPPIYVKGKDVPVHIYRPMQERTQAHHANVLQADVIGREQERRVISNHLQNLLRGASGNIIIEGDVGMGKNNLIQHIIQEAKSLGLDPLVGAGNAIENTTAYHAWQPIYRSMFDLGEGMESTIARSQAMRQLATNPSLLQRLPLLNAVVSFNMPDNDLTKQMQGDVRASNTRQFLSELLLKTRDDSPLLLIMDNAHWLDSASWALLDDLKEKAAQILVIIVTRPMIAGSVVPGSPRGLIIPPTYQELLQAKETVHLTLQALSPQDAVALACKRLGVSSLPANVKQLIQERADGIPLFIEEMVYALRDNGLIEITADGKATVTTNALEQAVPSNMQGMIRARIDQLPPSEQFTLKVASVVGRTFTLPLLKAVYPLEQDKEKLEENLATLIHLGLMANLPQEPAPTYVFKHLTAQEVAYDALAFSQKQQLHQEIATWLETHHTEELPLYYAVIAYHWEQTAVSGNPHAIQQALQYLELAGEQALREGANRESINYFEKVLALAQKHSLTEDRLRLANWHQKQAQAYDQLGETQHLREQAHQALRLLGYTPPDEEDWVLYRKFVRELFKHIWRMVRPQQEADPLKQQTALIASRVYRLLNRLDFRASQAGIRTVYCGLRAMTAAETVPQAYSDHALTLSTGYPIFATLQMNRLALYYEQRTLYALEKVDDLREVADAHTTLNAFKFGRTEWESLEQSIKTNVVRIEQVGGMRTLADGLGTLGYVYTYRGKFKQGVVEVAHPLIETGQVHDNVEVTNWGYFALAAHSLFLGEAQTSLEQLQTLKVSLVQSGDEPVLYAVNGLTALAYLWTGQKMRAKETAVQLANSYNPSLPLSITSYHTLTTPLRVLLTLWQTDNDVSVEPHIQHLLPIFKTHSRIYPASWPAYWVYLGWYTYLTGKQGRAKRLWKKAIKQAQQYHTPYDEALAHALLANHFPNEANHLAMAQELFKRMNAGYDLVRVEPS